LHSPSSSGGGGSSPTGLRARLRTLSEGELFGPTVKGRLVKTACLRPIASRS
jgi:hypothetical protein